MCIIFFLLIYIYFQFRFESYSSTNPSLIDYDNIFIYVIHKHNMTHRLDRFLSYLKQYFPNNPYKIIEPISIQQIESSLSDYLSKGWITPNTFNDIKNNETAIDGSHTYKSLSLALTNISIWKEELPKNRYFMILEDDFVITSSFLDHFQHILKNLPSHWDLIYLSCHIKKHEYSSDQIKNHLLHITTRTHGQGAILYNPHSLPILLKYIYPLSLQIDHDVPDNFIVPRLLRGYMAVDSNLNTIIHNDNYYYGSTTQAN